MSPFGPTSDDPREHVVAVGAVAPRPLAPSNRRVVDLTRLSRQRRAREDQGRFVVDGPVLVAEAVRAGLVVDDVFVDPEAVGRAQVDVAVASATAVGASAWAVRGGLAGHVEPRTPNGVAAVVRIPAPAAGPTGDGAGAVSPATAPGSTGDGAGPALHLVLVAVADPGNVGTLLRTAEAVGATSVLLTDGSVDPWSPKVVRASAGSVLRVPVHSASVDAALRDLGAAGVRRVGSRADLGVRPGELDLTGPVALVLGSEAHGLAPDLAPAVDAWAALPMRGEVESLNVAVAGSVLAYEVVRQRQVGPTGDS